MSDYAELVERLHDETRLPAQKDWDRHEAADAIKALVQEKSALAQLLLDTIKSDLKAKSALTECRKHAEKMHDALFRTSKYFPAGDQYRADFPKETDHDK